jgi:O-antigen ligase
MSSAVIQRQKQQAAVFGLLLMTLYGSAHLLASASTGNALMYVVGAVACVLAFLNEEIAVYFLIVAMLLSPEIDTGSRTQGATLGRSVTLRVDDFVLVIICATWFIKSMLYKEIGILKRTPLNAPMYLYSFAALFSTLLGILAGNVDPKSGLLFVLKYIEYFMIFWMVVNTTRNVEQVKRFLALALLVALITSLIGIAQIPRGVRVSAPFEGPHGEPNTFGGYMLFMLSIVGAFILIKTPYQSAAVILGGVFILAFAYTLSRASYLGFLAVAITLPILTRRYYILISVVVAGLVLLLAAENLLPTAVYDRIAFTFNQKPRAQQMVILGRRVDTSTSARLQYMGAAMDAFYDKPVFGWGVTGWHFIDSQYFRTLSETGLLGLSALFFLLVRTLQVGITAYRASRNHDTFSFALSSGFLAGTVGLMVHAIGSNTFIIVRVMEPFWLVCALVYLAPRLSTNAEDKCAA